uniref:RNA pseudouridine synthase n=1 Tax=Rhizophora mucronata TaxID=61149 RepID=A0A2P2KV43_RHIMU
MVSQGKMRRGSKDNFLVILSKGRKYHDLKICFRSYKFLSRALCTCVPAAAPTSTPEQIRKFEEVTAPSVVKKRASINGKTV